MELTGRLTADAKISTLKDERKVVNFSIAINDSFKAKGSEVVTKVTTYVNCSYWINPERAKYLTKGTVVEIYGRISVNAWVNAEGEAKASLNFHVHNFKLHGGGKATEAGASKKHEPVTAPVDDDLPF
ncbi:MAG: single-stranded DNA-binding protein [Sphingobacteriales bacterium]|nr:single-stranded DNA-binding protein [Sphingobacteriales bacterium]OJV98422.1 MAG: single-stranded DNA-binding protein [Sphingobacteriales bacterium 44-61]